MSLDELHSLCPIELDVILDTYYKEERANKEWERLNTFMIYCSQGGSEEIKSPKDLIPLPWDEEDEEMPLDEYQQLLDKIDILNTDYSGSK